MQIRLHRDKADQTRITVVASRHLYFGEAAPDEADLVVFLGDGWLKGHGWTDYDHRRFAEQRLTAERLNDLLLPVFDELLKRKVVLARGVMMQHDADISARFRVNGMTVEAALRESGINPASAGTLLN